MAAAGAIHRKLGSSTSSSVVSSSSSSTIHLRDAALPHGAVVTTVEDVVFDEHDDVEDHSEFRHFHAVSPPRMAPHVVALRRVQSSDDMIPLAISPVTAVPRSLSATSTGPDQNLLTQMMKINLVAQQSSMIVEQNNHLARTVKR